MGEGEPRHHRLRAKRRGGSGDDNFERAAQLHGPVPDLLPVLGVHQVGDHQVAQRRRGVSKAAVEYIRTPKPIQRTAEDLEKDREGHDFDEPRQFLVARNALFVHGEVAKARH